MTACTTESMEIDAPCEALRAVVLDQPGHAGWFPAMQGVDRVEAGEPSPLRASQGGAGFEGAIWRHRFAYTRLHVGIVRTADRTLLWHVADERGHILAEWKFDFAPLEDARRTRVTIEERPIRQSRLSKAWLWCARIRPGHYQRKYLAALRAHAERLNRAGQPST